MKKQTLKAHYLVPTVEAVEITPSAAILQASLDPQADISAVFAIEDLGITDTDAASAVWF